MNTSSLTASEFVCAFNRFFRNAPLGIAIKHDRLQILLRSIVRLLPKVALFAQDVADGTLAGESLVRAFLPLLRPVERLVESAGQIHLELLQARMDAGLPALPFTDGACGATAMAVLIHAAARVVAAVHEEIYPMAFSYPEDDPVHEYDVLAWNSTAARLRELFANQLRWPNPSRLLHELLIELARLDGRAFALIDLQEGRDDQEAENSDAFGPAVPPQDYNPATVPMPQAAQDSRNGTKNSRKKAGAATKEEPENEPLPSQPYPVYIVQRPGESLAVHTEGGSLQPARQIASEAFKFSSDFRSLCWGGREIAPFTETQAACMRVLWEALQNGTPSLAQTTILERAESKSVDSLKPQLRTVFRGHEAWKLVVVSVGKGLYRLQNPPQK